MSVNREWVSQLKPGDKVIIVNDDGDEYLATAVSDTTHGVVVERRDRQFTVSESHVVELVSKAETLALLREIAALPRVRYANGRVVGVIVADDLMARVDQLLMQIDEGVADVQDRVAR